MPAPLVLQLVPVPVLPLHSAQQRPPATGPGQTLEPLYLDLGGPNGS